MKAIYIKQSVLLLSYFFLVLVSGCQSDSKNDEKVDFQLTSDEANESEFTGTVASVNQLTRFSMNTSPEGLNAIGTINHPVNNEVTSGSFLTSVDVADEDGIAAVFLRFNDSDDALFLCGSGVHECGDTSFHRTKSAINLADFNIYRGPVSVELWATDDLEHHQLLDTINLDWQRSIIDTIEISRSVSGDTIDITWPDNAQYLNYNVYIASEADVTVNNFQNLENGQAFLSIESNSLQVTNLSTDLTYFVVIVGVTGSGESGFSSEIIMEPSIGSVNSAPLAVADNFSGNEDTTIVGNLLDNDFDSDENTLYITPIAIDYPEVGVLEIESNGNFHYYPPLDFFGSASFSYEIQDGFGGFAQAVVQLTVSPVNDDPIAVPDLTSTKEDITVIIDVLANDTDIDDTGLVVIAVGNNDHGVVTFDETQITYTPNSDFSGTTTFTYSISDANQATSTALVTVNVLPANDAPLAVDDAVTAIEDTPIFINVLINDIDIDTDTLTVSAVSEPNTGEVSIVDNQVLYTPGADYYGAASFSYTIIDQSGLTATAQVNVTVTPVNDAPVAIDDSTTMAEDTTVLIDVLANDTDIDNISLSLGELSGDVEGVYAISGKQISYTPTANFNGTSVFTYTVIDSGGLSAKASVSVNVTAVNDLPVIVNSNASVQAGSTVTVNVLDDVTDIDGDSLSVTAIGGDVNTALGTAVLNNDNTITFTAANDNQVGSVGVTFDVSDGGGNSSGTLSITVNPPDNQLPIAVNDSYSIKQGALLTVDSTTGHPAGILDNDSDPDGEALTFTVTGTTADGILTTNNDGTFTYLPSNSFIGVDSFTYQVDDGNEGTASATVTINVTVNQAPAAAPDYYSILPNSAANFTKLTNNDFDADNDSVLFNGVLAGQGTIFGVLSEATDSTFAYTPNTDVALIDSLFYEITDGESTSIGLATINVSEVYWLNSLSLPKIPAVNYRSIAFDGLDYFIAGENQIISSTDGTNWIPSYQDNESTIDSIAVGNTVYSRTVSTGMALKQNAKYFVHQGRETDGLSFLQHFWSERYSMIPDSMNRVVNINNQFFMLGEDKIYLSEDGATWQDISPAANGANYLDIIEFNNVIIAVGEDGVIARYVDGVWENVVHSLGDEHITGISSHASLVVAVGHAGQIFTSSDGANWAASSSSTSNTLHGVANDGSTFLAVGENSTAITSNDGISWTLQLGLDAADLYDVIWDGDEFIMTGDNANVVTSSNGSSFSDINNDDYSNFNTIAYSGASIVRAGTNAPIYSSADAIAWTASAAFYSINKIEFFNGQFIAVGDNGLVMTSSDGINWNTQTAVTSENIHDVNWYTGASLASIYVAVGDNGLLMTSLDAINWTIETLAPDDSGVTNSIDNLNGVTHDNGYFIAVGDTGQIVVRDYTQQPGASWMDFSNSTFGNLNDVEFDGTTNIIVGDNGTIIKGTPSANNFTMQSLPEITINLNALAWQNDAGDNFYIAVGDQGNTYTSDDASIWRPNTLGSTENLNDVLLIGESALVVGEGGTFLIGVPNVD